MNLNLLNLNQILLKDLLDKGNHLKRYGYSLDDWRCIFALNANIDELRFVQEALGMNDSES